MKTAEQIAQQTERFNNHYSNRREINRLFREQDDSRLWPINGRFNATDRAIRRAQRFMRNTGYNMAGLEYAYFLENEIGLIVNSQG